MPMPSKEQWVQSWIEATEKAKPKMNAKKIGRFAGTLSRPTLVFDYGDWGQVYIELSRAGTITLTDKPFAEPPALRIVSKPEIIHNVAIKKASMMDMFLKGKVKVEGLPGTKLMPLMPLLDPVYKCYREEWGD